MRNIYILLVLYSLGALSLKAQISITSVGTAYTQNFNSLSSASSATWTNNSTISGWYAEQSSGAVSTISISNGSSSTGAFYNYGSTSSSDRSIGSMNDNTIRDLYYGVRLKNNSGGTI